MKLYDKNAVAKFLDMTPKNVERLTQKGILQTKHVISGKDVDDINLKSLYIAEYQIIKIPLKN